MEEDWRALAGTVLGTLTLVVHGADGLLQTMRIAHRKLAACVRALDILKTGGAINADDVQEAPSARAFLDDARRELVRLQELQGTVRHVFDIYDAMLGLSEDGHPRWQRWEGQSRETSRHAGGALRCLRSATSNLLASRNALLIARSSPHLSADWTAWISEALSQLRLAMFEAAMATCAARQMRDAAEAESHDAWMVSLLLSRYDGPFA